MVALDDDSAGVEVDFAAESDCLEGVFDYSAVEEEEVAQEP